ncbi:extracellular solute-binding protein [Paenibacillus filicis]|uniref:Extracellular solute-binding protein n=1 Tax=Paenibacillus gyeongsangnamensis TaxID=3388067 RepID=A0ABT4QLZ1_9BACL|nr:extracellular solute-binding protein [Paenibacillus filicis]MCZ8517731.1 extracellular solute-binding protein [Paenibacillus filicis]
MGEKMAKRLSVLLAGVLALSTVGGCSKGESESKSQQGGKLTSLTYWTEFPPQFSATMKSYGEVEAYKELEKRTGVHVEFQHPPSGQVTDNFNLMLASGQLPDVIYYDWTSVQGGPQKAIQDGKIVKLNDYIDKYAPNFKKVLDTHPEWKKQIVTEDGSIYSMPFIRGDKYLQSIDGMVLRQDWLDKLNLPVPTTIDEWHTVLQAFKEKDPNGNGKNDEIPLLIDKGGIGGNRAFVGAWGITTDFYQVNGKVKFGPIQPEYKQFLTLMNQWYKEGLLDKDFASTDGKLKDAKVTGNQLGATNMAVGGGIGKYTDLMAGSNPGFKLVAAPNPVLKPGDKPILGHRDNAYLGLGAAITTANKNIVETVKWLDYGYSDEGHMLFNFGVEGTSYKMENGYPKYADALMKSPDGLPVQQALAKHNLATWNGPFVQDRRYIEQYAGKPEQRHALDIWSQPSNERLLPRLTYTAEESAKNSSVMSDINTYLNEMYNKFVMGIEPLDNFDKFVKTIQGMGIDEAVKIRQAALDRYNK